MSKITILRKSNNGQVAYNRWTMDELVDEIKSTRYASVMRELRVSYPLIMRDMKSQSKDILNHILNGVPFICFSTEKGKKNGENRIFAYNPLLLLTISNLRDESLAEDIRNRAAMLPYTRLTFVGIDGHSVGIVCELSSLGKDLSTKDDYQELLRRASLILRKVYADHLHTIIDKADSLLDNDCRMPSDSNAFYNTLSTPFPIDMLRDMPKGVSASASIDPVVNVIPKVDTLEEATKWRRIYIDNLRKAQQEINGSNGKDKIFETLLLLAKYCHETAMPQALAERYATLNSDFATLSMSSPVQGVTAPATQGSVQGVTASAAQSSVQGVTAPATQGSVQGVTAPATQGSVQGVIASAARSSVQGGIASAARGSVQGGTASLASSSDFGLIRDTFATEYEKDLKSYNPKKHLNPTAQLMRRTSFFMNTHFVMRKNVLNGVVEYRMNDGSDFDFHILTPEVQNTMTIMALESGLNSWDKDLNRFIHSKRIPEYDPINNWLDSLPEWDGVDRIAEIADRIPTDTPNWQNNFHIWMRSMVAQWMGRDDQHGNAIAPILIGPQATGKSSFCRILLPEHLLDYYNDSIHFKDDKSVFLALSSFALINIDEFDSLSKSQQPLLKYLLSKTDVKFRGAYKNFIEQHKRYASFIGTTNKRQPLTDPTGSRRFICVNVKGSIDFTTPILYNKVYAQLRDEVNAGKRYWFTKEEADVITAQNSPYQSIEDISYILTRLYRQPEENEECLRLNLEEIEKDIRKNYPTADLGDNPGMRIGRILKSQGFTAKKAVGGKKYYAIQKK